MSENVDHLFDVQGLTVLVTGGSRGIGAMIAEAFVQRGADVIITSRDAETCMETSRRLQSLGFCRAVPGDVSNLAGIRALAAHLEATCERLDVLINNAGTTWGAPIADFPESGWDKTIDLNLKSPFFLVQSLLPLMEAATQTGRAPRIVNIASIDGMRPPDFESYAYSSSKAGLLMLTRHLAKHLASRGILVNALAPGFFRTKMTKGILAEAGDALPCDVPLGRLGEADDIAGTALFLASRASAYITGAVITCDGGISGAD